MELFNYSTPEKAFKTSVRPLSYLLIIQAISLFYLFITWPSTEFVNFPIPFIPDVFKYSFLIATAILILIIGIGLFIRSKIVWYIFLAYISLGPIWLIFGIAFDYFPESGPKLITIPLAIVFSGLIAIGLYIVTKPAFKKTF